MTELLRFLASHTPCAELLVRWEEIELRGRVFIGVPRPPTKYITSVRAAVLRRDEVLVVRDPGETHCTPGGRREPGESLLATLRREVLEETGWGLARIRRLGFIHYHHLTPRPPDYRYPYPDFLQALYAAQAGAYHPEAKERGGWEQEACFRSIDAVLGEALTSTPRCVLEAARKVWGA